MSSLLGEVMESAATQAPMQARPIAIITAEIQVLKAQVGGGLAEIGNRLNEAKAQLSHGEWLPWLEEQVQFSPVQAQRFMRLAKEYPNTSPVTYLGMRKALALLAFQPEERAEFVAEPHVVSGQVKHVSDMTAHELERAIQERKEALEAKAEAERESAAQSEQVSALKKELEELRKQPIETTYSDVPNAAALDAARKAGADEAAKTARREAEEKLNAKLEKAVKAKADAEAQVQTIKSVQEATAAKAGALEQQLKLMGNPAATEYKVHFDVVQKSLFQLNACLDRIKASDPELCDRLTAALIALGKKTYEDAMERLNGEEKS